MISSVLFHELAEGELVEAARYYESEKAGLGVAFLDEAERAIKELQENPESGQVVLRIIRRKLLRRFPYSVMYSVVDDEVHVLAIANQKRRPFYWRQRKG